MSQPPAKRQRTLSSRADIASAAPPKENRSPKSKFKVSGAGQGFTTASTARSPSKRAKLTEQNATKKGALDRFFQPTANVSTHGAGQATLSGELTEEDAIQDDFSDGGQDLSPVRRTRPPASKPASSRERNLRPAIAKAGAYAGKGEKQSLRNSQEALSASTSLPWSEMLTPQDAGELAVHKKKVSDVRLWLSNVLSGRERKRLLVLEGPSGVGKSTTIHVLAKELDFQIVEWTNAAPAYSAGMDGSGSMVSRFDDFLNRSGSYTSLVVEDATRVDASEIWSNALPNGRQKVIVAEEFPVTLPFNEDSLKAFRASVLQYLVSNWNSPFFPSGQSFNDPQVPTPLVMIVSESRTSASASGSDGLTAHRLLGNDLLTHPAVTSIEFNPMAPTLIIKALELIIRKEARHSGRRRVPGHEVLKALSEIGDLRSAIGSLEFLCKKGGKDGDWSGRVAAVKGGKSAPTSAELDAIRTIALRNSTLSLFHAVGKVLYNKRVAPCGPSSELPRPVDPPDYLKQHARSYESEVNVDTLMDETGADTSTFIATLHENFAWSCNGEREVHNLEECLDVLSDTDVLAPSSSRQMGGRTSGQRPWANRDAVDFILQDEITFRTAASGLLFSLPYPVQRSNATQSRGKNSDAFKMFYPTSLRLWKKLEECRSTISNCTSQSLAGSKTPIDAAERGPDEAYDRSNRLLEELVLERLPYLYKIRKAKGNTLGIADLEAVTQFRGMNTGDEDDDSAEEPGSYRSSFATVKAARSETSQPAQLPTTGVSNDLHAFANNLILSDDDIEDG